MTWGILVQRPVTAEQVPGYANIFEDRLLLPQESPMGAQPLVWNSGRTLRISIRETLGNQGAGAPIVWQ